MSKFNQKLSGFLVGLLISGLVAAADPVALNPSHPDRHVVERGDTLWDISSTFLRDPWRWPDIWFVNPQIANPHLIYPGDIIELTYVDGEPRLNLVRGSGDLKLSPKIRSTPIDTAIPTIPIDAIKQFLTRPYVMEKDAMESAPYVVRFLDEHIVGGAGNSIYVRAIENPETWQYDVIRPGKAYKDPDTEEILGYEAKFIGDAELKRPGDPAKLFLKRTQLETIIGDRLLPVTEEVSLRNFHPRSPANDIEGRIIGVLNGVSQIGQYNVVVLNKGDSDGLEPGHVMRIFQGGELVRDRVSPRRNETYQLPLEEAGVLMVFRTFSRVSFALIMHATKPLHVLDWVRTPET